MTRARNIEIDELLEKAERRGELLAVPDAAARRTLRYRVARGEAVSPAPGVFCRAAYWQGLERRRRALLVIRALQALHPEWVFCHGSAAVALGLPVSYEAIEKIHIVTSRRQRARSLAWLRRHTVEGDRIVVANGVRVTSPQRTVFDCMRGAEFARALAVADAALRAGIVSKGSLRSFVLANGRHRPGARHTLRTLNYADPLSESAGESIARAVALEGGFALPRLQIEMPDPIDPATRYRPDFCWVREDGTRVLGEFDGLVKYRDPACLNGRTTLQALADERKREARLSLYGMPIVRFGYRDVMNRSRFYRLLESYGVPRCEKLAGAIARRARSRSVSGTVFAFFELPSDADAGEADPRAERTA